ncbi:MAG TPA: hypothetical protein VNS22_18905 [Geminicoccus sp.]|uniref:hypothetical protein n=1 Tax=Geminicoccus sp. TaxID=2024832 RepID=UPI002C2A2C11|nr:hypothetical protein [Geminicoccus sp.]HWL70430.1 hypothetical protein [Geminicoccus sp.]
MLIIQMAQMWRGGMGSPVMPRAGGWLDQPAALIDCIHYAADCLAKLEPKKKT